MRVLRVCCPAESLIYYTYPATPTPDPYPPCLPQVFEQAERVPELQQGQLLSLVERWLREEQRQRQAAAERQRALGAGASSGSLEDMHLASWNNGWVGGRLASSLKHSANAVMRM